MADTIEIHTSLTVKDCSTKLRNICRSLNADISSVPHEDAFGVEEHPDLDVLATGTKLLGRWAVEISVTDTGSDRIVEFTPLGMGLLARTVVGALNSDEIGQNAKIGTSSKVAQEMAAAFR